MELEKIEAETLCDNGACGAIAAYAVVREGTPMRMRLHLCEACIGELHELFGRHLADRKTENEQGGNENVG